jgi:hypothetical protein
MKENLKSNKLKRLRSHLLKYPLCISNTWESMQQFQDAKSICNGKIAEKEEVTIQDICMDQCLE